jgi:hypothetical protein
VIRGIARSQRLSQKNVENFGRFTVFCLNWAASDALKYDFRRTVGYKRDCAAPASVRLHE